MKRLVGSIPSVLSSSTVAPVMGVLSEASTLARSHNHSVITALTHGGWAAIVVIALIVVQVLLIVYAVRKWNQRG